jgi:3',5'-cyclic AMP phosphodiesterase CpdA
MTPFSFVHLTDIHIVAPGRGELYGLHPAARLAEAVESIAQRHGPGGPAPASFAVITGDLAHWGEPEAYAVLAQELARLPIPYYLLIGNHDDRTAFRAAFPQAPVDEAGFVQCSLKTPVGRFLLLDTNELGTHAGRYCERRLAWLSAQLAGDEEPVFLFLHHPPVRVGIHRMDSIPLLDAAGLWEVLRPHRERIRHLFHGHLHRPLAGSWHGIPTSSLRGTAHQVALDLAERETVPGSHEPPAYALVRITEEDVVVHTHDFLSDAPAFHL